MITTISKPTQTEVIDCNTCLFDSSFAKIESDGRCEYCHLQEQLKNQAREPFINVVERIKKKGKGKKYDCLVGISGGEDSSCLLFLTVEVWKLRPLVIHFDNHWNVPEANNNIEVLVKNLNVDFIRYFVNKKEYDLLNDAMLMAGTQDCDIVNDVAMARLMDMTCKKYGIKYILNGHDFRNEGSSPAAWSRIDSKYLESAYKKHIGFKLENYPLYTVWNQITAGLMGIKQIRPFHYDKVDRKPILNKLYSWGWKQYSGKHCENIYTWFIGAFVLPKKFRIDKRLTYLSAQIREGVLSKFQAKEFLLQKSEFDLNLLGKEKSRILHLVDSSPIRSRDEYKMYNFKKWKFILFFMAKLKIVPWTFYVKYTK